MVSSKPQNFIRINHYIRANEVRVISESGENLGVFSLTEALKRAKEQGVDLIEVNGKANPPITRLMELSKWKFMEKKAQQEKKQKVLEQKEIQLRPTTDTHDVEIKVGQAKKFLEEGHRVKFTIKMRGREMQHLGIPSEKLKAILEMLGDGVQVVSAPSMDMKNMSMIVGKESKK